MHEHLAIRGLRFLSRPEERGLPEGEPGTARAPQHPADRDRVILQIDDHDPEHARGTPPEEPTHGAASVPEGRTGGGVAVPKPTKTEDLFLAGIASLEIAPEDLGDGDPLRGGPLIRAIVVPRGEPEVHPDGGIALIERGTPGAA